MNYVKQLGLRLMSQDFDRQVAEVQIRAAVMNRFTALGIRSLWQWDKCVRRKGNCGRQLICATEPLCLAHDRQGRTLDMGGRWRPQDPGHAEPVSYTHLTLPTSDLV